MTKFAAGSIGEDTKRAFVTEVERVGRDPVYWVRREASFAVGALAKVVPVEVVTSSLVSDPCPGTALDRHSCGCGNAASVVRILVPGLNVACASLGSIRASRHPVKINSGAPPETRSRRHSSSVTR